MSEKLLIESGEEGESNILPKQVTRFPDDKIRRDRIGLKVFANEADFIEWQEESPRQIFEITPLVVDRGSCIVLRICVSYAAGIING